MSSTMKPGDIAALTRLIGLYGLTAVLGQLPRSCELQAIQHANAGQHEAAAAFDAARREARAAVRGAALADALDTAAEELKACSAWQDALEGEDNMMLEAVNAAERLVAEVDGREFMPHAVGDEP